MIDNQDSRAACSNGVLLFSAARSAGCHGILLQGEAIASQPELIQVLRFENTVLTASKLLLEIKLTVKVVKTAFKITFKAISGFQKGPSFFVCYLALNKSLYLIISVFPDATAT